MAGGFGLLGAMLACCLTSGLSPGEPPPSHASSTTRSANLGAGADFYQAQGRCPGPVERGLKVPRGGDVPPGPGRFLLERGGRYHVDPRSHAVFGAYGEGAAPYIDSQWVGGVGDIRYDNLRVPEVWGGSVPSTGRISVTNSSLGGTSISINTTLKADSGPPWTIACDDVGSAGLGANSDSCLLVLATDSVVVGNRIAGCGDGTGYGKHGVYAKARDIRMGYNSVSDVPGGADGGQAFSVRYPGARVDHNVYDGTGSTSAAVAYFGQSSARHGTLVIEDNDFVTVALWLDPYDSEGNSLDWVVRRNTVRPTGGETVFVRGGSINPYARWTFRRNDLTGFESVDKLSPCPGAVIRRQNVGTNRGTCPR